MKRKRLEAIPGIVPNLLFLPPGCRFQDRCTYVNDDCRKKEPELRTVMDHPEIPHATRCMRDI
ncbi:MAG: hypothetical protein A2070_10725 [Bdellovibrionales bacterium GWC1_52_8]|nr:MAG: hypothetical protein A2070_10725 [Bdellovibrionales bacterium GWC1_52_8]